MTTPTATTAVTATAHLITVITHWPDLNEALGAPAKVASFGIGLRNYLAALDRLDGERAEAEHHRARALRLLERDPAQLGERPIPLRVAILDTMRAVHADLLDCADQTAAAVQRSPMGQLSAGYPAADRARRAVLAMRDAHDPRRWKWTGPRPDARYTALWLLGRAQGAPGPFHSLPTVQVDRIAVVARNAAQRIETALDIADQLTPISQPCPECGGRIDIHGGAGAAPVARCKACGRTWTEQPAAALPSR